MPRTPSQKSIDVWRLAPTSVMWWTPWLCSLRNGPLLVLDESVLVFASWQAAPRHELHARLDRQHLAQARADRVGQRGVGVGPVRELHGDRQRRLLLDAR